MTSQPRLAPNGEVALYVDDDQFDGRSQDTCGPEAVAVFWHSINPANPPQQRYTSAEVHAMAVNYYTQFIGPDDSADHNGTSNKALYDMLDFAGFKSRYFEGPLSAEWATAWLKEGYAVIVGFAESSAFDVDLNANPYQNWNPTGLFHVINLTGIDSEGNFLVRDTANLDTSGKLRPGPRRYKPDLAFTSVTMIAQSWMPVPTAGTPPTAPAPAPEPAPATPAPATDYKAQLLAALASAQEAASHL